MQVLVIRILLHGELFKVTIVLNTPLEMTHATEELIDETQGFGVEFTGTNCALQRSHVKTICKFSRLRCDRHVLHVARLPSASPGIGHGFTSRTFGIVHVRCLQAHG